jgi:uncharacterized protein involved in exopolysaccharide biosynthesis/Mrp family chromosome partitioning ATPase
MAEGRNELSPYLRVPSAASEPWAGTLADEDPALVELWRVVRKQIRLILGLVTISVGCAALAVLLQTPIYTASATLQIERQAPRVAPVRDVQEVDASTTFERYDYYETQFQILKSRVLAARVIQALHLEDDPRLAPETSWISSGIAALRARFSRRPRAELEGSGREFGVDGSLIDRYLASLSVTPVKGSRLVTVSFSSRSPALAASVANAHVDQYLESLLEQRSGLAEKAKEILDAELEKARGRLAEAERALNEFRRRSGVVAVEGERTDVASSRFEDLNARYTAAQAERIAWESQYRLIESGKEESLPEVVSSKMIQDLKQEVARAEAERAELGRIFEPAYPKMAAAIAREQQLKARLREEIGKIVEGIRSSYLAAKNREEALARSLAEQRQVVLAQKDVGAEYAVLERDVETARSLYNDLLRRVRDLDVAGATQFGNISIVEPAAVPRVPSSPRKLLTLGVTAAASLLAGVLLAFVRERLDSTLKTAEDVERSLGLPTLGIVPSYGAVAPRNGRAEAKLLSFGGVAAPAAGSVDRVVEQAPRSVLAEAYRTIRTALLLSSPDAPPQVLLFTSGAAGEGKTATAINEALALAGAGGRVLLIDADIRKPRLHRVFDVANGVGLSTYLAGFTPLETVIHPVPIGASSGNGHDAAGTDGVDGVPRGRLWVLPSGPVPPNPAELLGSRRMRDTLERLREEHDFIVIDTPPVLPVTDAVVLSAFCDAVILVVKGQKTPARVVAQARDRLARARARVVGVVLNDVDVTGADYRDDYPYAYAYYDRTAEP